MKRFLDERNASLDDVIHKAGFERNAAIVACKEAANDNDETRKRFEVMCREVSSLRCLVSGSFIA
jgi:type I restriction enzyme R subunit